MSELLDFPKGLPKGPEIINPKGDRVDIRIDDYLSSGMCQALSSYEVSQIVDHNSSIIYRKVMGDLTDEYKDVKVGLYKISRDSEGMVPVSGDDFSVTVVPGLIGLDSLDVEEIEQDGLSVRLYCGLYLAHLLVQQRYLRDRFFKVAFTKAFGIQSQGVNDRVNDIDGQIMVDKRIRLRHHRISIARLSSGIALSAVLDPEEQKLAKQVMVQRYDSELEDCERMSSSVIEQFGVSEGNIPWDSYPSESRGFSEPLNKDQVDHFLRGNISAI